MIEPEIQNEGRPLHPGISRMPDHRLNKKTPRVHKHKEDILALEQVDRKRRDTLQPHFRRTSAAKFLH